jgi:hypothetical protein
MTSAQTAVVMDALLERGLEPSSALRAERSWAFIVREPKAHDPLLPTGLVVIESVLGKAQVDIFDDGTIAVMPVGWRQSDDHTAMLVHCALEDAGLKEWLREEVPVGLPPICCMHLFDHNVDLGGEFAQAPHVYCGVRGLTASRRVRFDPQPLPRQSVTIKDEDGSLANHDVIFDAGSNAIETGAMTARTHGPFGETTLAWNGARWTLL